VSSLPQQGALGAPARILITLGRSVRAGTREGLPWREFVRELDDLGNRSVPLVAGGMAFLGLVMITHGALQARRVVGDLAVVGPAYFGLLVREFGPAVSGLFAAVRIGAAIGAQTASMAATEQLDAIRLCAADPLREVVAPRLAASLLIFPVLGLVGTATAAAAAALFATYGYGADGWSFLDARFVTRWDLLQGALKELSFGALVPIAACREGFSARAGASAIGEAMTRAVVSGCLCCIAADLVIAVAFHLAGV
jgi:phospholipid/cholesterol/gamma-HCH transport system permease protein